MDPARSCVGAIGQRKTLLGALVFLFVVMITALVLKPKAASQVPSFLVQHVYILGCGHSGTSLLKRTIANLPGGYCIRGETRIFLNSKPLDFQEKRWVQWDAAARAGNFTFWVEKTPKHVTVLDQLFRKDPSAKVFFIVRDGRDVMLSLMERGYSPQKALGRYI
jgi:hypothetical protein